MSGSRQPSLYRERDRGRDRYRDRDREYGDQYHNHQLAYRGSSSSGARRSRSPRYRASSSHPPPPDYHSSQPREHREPYREYRDREYRDREYRDHEYRGSSRAPHRAEPDRYDSHREYRDREYRDREYRGSSRAPHRAEPDRYDGRRPSSSQPRNYAGGDYYQEYSSRARHSRSRSPRRSQSPRYGSYSHSTNYSPPPPHDFNSCPPEARSRSKAPSPMGEARSSSKAPSPMGKREPSSSAAIGIGEHPKKAAKAEKQVDRIPLRDKPEHKWREMSIVTEEVERACKNATSLGDVKKQISDSTKLEPKKPFEDFRANVIETRLRSRVAHEQPPPQDTIVLDDESDDGPASNNDDGEFLPLNTRKKRVVSSLSLNGNQGKKGRGKGNKNKQVSKETLREELKQSKAKIEALRAAEIKVDNEFQSLPKPAVSSLFSSGTKTNQTNTHPFIGVKKAIIDNKEDLKFEMIGSAIEDRFIEQIYDGCLLPSTDTQWSDVGGLEEVKKSMKEVVIDPLRRPDIFTGLRAAPKGVLLYGPPGTGKTLIARCIASQCQSTFFNVSASKLTSKWVGDGEKTVQALFAVARAMQPSVIFIDEVDSVLSKRTEKENESSKKMKTEFLVQMEGAATKTENDQILVIGATNRPADLDEAVRRRFQKKFLIPLPDAQARLQILQATFRREKTTLTHDDYKLLADVLNGYSGADLRNVCKEAAMIPVRECRDMLDSISVSEIRPTAKEDVLCAAQKIKPTVSPKDLGHYREFDKLYGDKP